MDGWMTGWHAIMTRANVHTYVGTSATMCVQLCAFEYVYIYIYRDLDIFL